MDGRRRKSLPSTCRARVVKAFNHLPAKLLAEDPCVPGGRRVLFLAGTDASARSEVAALIEKLGFFGIDLGQLNEGGRAINIPGGTLPIQNLIRLD
jgi:8-hydroxy-5-deazaflavin:NADPH oxidoreductase